MFWNWIYIIHIHIHIHTLGTTQREGGRGREKERIESLKTVAAGLYFICGTIILSSYTFKLTIAFKLVEDNLLQQNPVVLMMLEQCILE